MRALVNSACEKGGDWTKGLELQSSKVTYNTAISACEKGGEWTKGLDLLSAKDCSVVTWGASGYM